jgi:hypothetical protein
LETEYALLNPLVVVPAADDVIRNVPPFWFALKVGSAALRKWSF